jgi:hypothetical protein
VQREEDHALRHVAHRKFVGRRHHLEDAMRKKTPKQKQKPSPDTLLKTSKKKDIELTETELRRVAGGAKVAVEYKPQKAD